MDCVQSELKYICFDDKKQQNDELLQRSSGVKFPKYQKVKYVPISDNILTSANEIPEAKPAPFRFEPITPVYQPVTYDATTLEPSIAVPGRLFRSPDRPWIGCIHKKVGRVRNAMEKRKKLASDLSSILRQFREEKSFSAVPLSRKASALIARVSSGICMGLDKTNDVNEAEEDNDNEPIYTGNPSEQLFNGRDTPYDVQLDQEKNNAVELKEDRQIKAVEAALTEINEMRQSTGLVPMSTAAVIKFLVARDFDVENTITLYKNYQSRRQLYRLANMSPFRNPLQEEIYSGRFTVLETRDQDGAGVVYFSAQRFSHEADHNIIMNNIFFQMDELIKSSEIQKNGVVLLYDFSDVTYKNCDIKLCAKILNLFKEAYPVLLKKVFVISPPFWFAAGMRLLQPGLLRAMNIDTVSPTQLKERLPVTCIPESLGGTLLVNHLTWICQCMFVHSERVVSGNEKLPRLLKRGLVYSRPSQRKTSKKSRDHQSG